MHFNLKPGLLVPLLVGAVMGPALQIQQAQLWPLPVYVGLCVAAVSLLWWATHRHRHLGLGHQHLPVGAIDLVGGVDCQEGAGGCCHRMAGARF